MGSSQIGFGRAIPLFILFVIFVIYNICDITICNICDMGSFQIGFGRAIPQLVYTIWNICNITFLQCLSLLCTECICCSFQQAFMFSVQQYFPDYGSAEIGNNLDTFMGERYCHNLGSFIIRCDYI